MALQTKSNNRKNITKESALKEIATEQMVKLTINIPKSLHSEFKIATIRNNSDMTSIMISLIKDYTYIR